MNKSENSQEKLVSIARKTEMESPVHPICANAVDLHKCERFVERLEEAALNIKPL